MRGLRNIDVAFVQMNLPFTMTSHRRSAPARLGSFASLAVTPVVTEGPRYFRCPYGRPIRIPRASRRVE